MDEGRKEKNWCCRSLDVVFYYFVLLQMSPRESNNNILEYCNRYGTPITAAFHKNISQQFESF